MLQHSCGEVELDLEVLAYFLNPLSPNEGTPDILGMLGCSLGSKVLWGKEALTWKSGDIFCHSWIEARKYHKEINRERDKALSFS